MSDLPTKKTNSDAASAPRRRIVGMYDRPEKTALEFSPLLISGLLIGLLVLVAFVLFMLLR